MAVPVTAWKRAVRALINKAALAAKVDPAASADLAAQVAGSVEAEASVADAEEGVLAAAEEASADAAVKVGTRAGADTTAVRSAIAAIADSKAFTAW